MQAAVTYRTKQGTYVAFRASGNNALGFPNYRNQSACHRQRWSVKRGNGGCGSPFVTSTDGINNMIVWVVGTQDHMIARGPAVTRL